MLSVALSRKIAALRWARQMTQKDLAEQMTQNDSTGQVNVSRTLVAAWESGRSSPSSEQIALLAKALKVSPSSLQPFDAALPKQEELDELAKQILERGERICGDLSDELQRGALNPIAQDAIEIAKREQKAHETGEWQHPLDKAAHDRFLGLVQDAILPFFPAGLIVFSEESIKDQGKMQPILLLEDSDPILFRDGVAPVFLRDGRAYDTLPDGRMEGSIEIGDYVIIDPLDRTAEAVRGIAGFANLTVGSLAHGPLMSVVFSLFDQYVTCYYAITGGGAWVKYRNGVKKPIFPSTVSELRGASIAAYVGRPARLSRLADCRHLADHHGDESVFVNASGCYGFCLVAASQVDAFIEVAKGYAWHDIVAGAHILQEAGGVVKSLGFSDLSDPLDPSITKTRVVLNENDVARLATAWEHQEQRTNRTGSELSKADRTDPKERRIGRSRFIAAATYELGGQIAIELARDQVPEIFDVKGAG